MHNTQYWLDVQQCRQLLSHLPVSWNTKNKADVNGNLRESDTPLEFRDFFVGFVL